ncbi:MAG: hypothetical protein FWD75_02495 [Propionibacteriaceae bacterium]|nr:hypothetical protein [Propionibacteriaceae bacterium]
MHSGHVQDSVRDLLAQIDRTFWGPAERALIDQALDFCHQCGDEDLEYQVRMRLTSSAARSCDDDTVVDSFLWCLARHDQDSARFPNDVGTGVLDVMWQFPWVIRVMDSSPRFSLAQCDQMLDSMETHYRREGFGRFGVLAARFRHAWSTGDIATALAVRPQLRDMCASDSPDSHGCCVPCVLSDVAGFSAQLCEDDTSLLILDEIVDTPHACGEEPEHARSRTLMSQLRFGRVDDAVDAHMSSYRLAREEPDKTSIVADDLVFCAITGNPARGLAMVERHIGWLSNPCLTPARLLDLETAICVVLESVIRCGHADLPVRGADADELVALVGPHEGPWTVAELRPVLAALVARSAHAFDVRNQNAYVSRQVERTMASLDTPFEAPIHTDVFPPAPQTAIHPSTAQEWLDLAQIAVDADLPAAGIRAAREVLAFPHDDDGLAHGGPEGRRAPRDGTSTATQRAQALRVQMSCHVRQGEFEQAKRLMPARALALREEGRERQAEVEERAGLAMFGRHDPEDLQALEEELARLAPTDGDELADVELSLASILTDLDQGDAARVLGLLQSSIVHAGSGTSVKTSALIGMMVVQTDLGFLDQAMTWADTLLALDVPTGCRAFVLGTRARLLGALERFDEGVLDADAAARVYADWDVAEGVVGAVLLSSALCLDAGRREDEISRLRHALREADRLQTTTTGIRFRLGRALVATGHPQEGIEILWEVLRDEENAQVPPEDRAETCDSLGQAFSVAKKWDQAVSMYHRAADLLEQARDPVGEADMLRCEGAIWHHLKHWDKALETLSDAWGLVSDQDARGARVNVLEAWSFAKAAVGDTSATDDLDTALALVVDDPTGPYPGKVAALTESKARVWMNLNSFDEAIAAFLQAGDLYACVHDTVSQVRCEHLAARYLAGVLGRLDDAITIWHDALAHADAGQAEGTDMSEWHDTVLLNLAVSLDRVGRSAEAARMRLQMSGP